MTDAPSSIAVVVQMITVMIYCPKGEYYEMDWIGPV